MHDSLHISDFTAYFEAVNGPSPFPWQHRLARHVATDGWPEQLDLPTGTGKTAAIDIAVFNLALQAARPPAERTASRRIVLVVDRRVVVDQAHERAQRLAKKLREAQDGILAAVAKALRSLAGDRGTPLEAAVLRGGMLRDHGWAKSPVQPLVISSTVDQVGSRLLFRGYGVSDSMRPVHAGLLGNDTLLLLDEVHLSAPFEETLSCLTGACTAWAEEPLPRRFHAVRMSATPGASKRSVFGLDAADLAHAGLAPRLGASKQARLQEVKVRGDEDNAFVEACAAAALELLGRGARVVGVIVNRVDTARRAHARIAADSSERFDVAILTGRMRPLDRDLVYHGAPGVPGLAARVRAGRDRTATHKPLVVVATQTLEAGADFDFDALVTECASLDALRQRFGRLDRLGELQESEAVILARKSQVSGKGGDDPIYGSALAATWAWMHEVAQGGGAKGLIDFGIRALPVPDPEVASGLVAPREHAPVLLPPYLDAWSQTSPAPAADPDVSFWLHGRRAPADDVQIVWRADVDEALLRAELDGDTATAADIVAACPPASIEAISVPLYAARRWLRGAGGERPFGDVEIGDANPPDEDARDPTDRGRPALRWAGDDSRVILPDDIRPGDTLVVPASYGGIEHHVWAPDAGDEVSDHGDLAQLLQRARPTLRLHPAVMKSWVVTAGDAVALPAPPVWNADAGQAVFRTAVDDWLRTLAACDQVAPWVQCAATLLAQNGAKGWRRVPVAPEAVTSGPGPSVRDAYDVLVGRRRYPEAVRTLQKARASGSDGSAGTDSSNEDASSLFTSVAVGLQAHLDGVGRLAGGFARACGLAVEIAEAVELAARLHDAGKADPRFQQMLYGGSEIAVALGDELLAKSDIPAHDRRARGRARSLAGYPRGARHELMSVALVDGSAALGETARADLVLHLIASHHGHCRPLAPPVFEPVPVEVEARVAGHRLTASSDHGLARLDAGIADRYWRMVRRFGWHGLAWLEALVRLADQCQSEMEQTETSA